MVKMPIPIGAGYELAAINEQTIGSRAGERADATAARGASDIQRPAALRMGVIVAIRT